MPTYPLSERERQRLARTLGAVPVDAQTGLEIGFCDLRLTALLAQRLELVSVDLPRVVPDGKKFRLAFADIQRLPFADSAFDIVVCTEVLEHLADEVLERSVLELRRVARKYLLLTVPYRQHLWAGQFKCAHCEHECHAQGHVQSFDEARLLRLFPDTRVARTELIASVPGNGPAWMYAVANRMGNSWHPLVFGDRCPSCNQDAKIPAPNPLGALTRRILWRVEALASPRAAWILVLLELSGVESLRLKTPG